MTDKTIKKIMDAYNDNKLRSDSDIEDYAKKHHLKFDDILKCIMNHEMIYERCWGCEHIADRAYPGMESQCTYCKRRIKIKDNYEKSDEQFRQNVRIKKIPGTQFADLNALEHGTRFYVKNGNWTGFVFVKDHKKYIHIDAANKDSLITGKESLIITILPPNTEFDI